MFDAGASIVQTAGCCAGHKSPNASSPATARIIIAVISPPAKDGLWTTRQEPTSKGPPVKSMKVDPEYLRRSSSRLPELRKVTWHGLPVMRNQNSIRQTANKTIAKAQEIDRSPSCEYR